MTDSALLETPTLAPATELPTEIAELAAGFIHEIKNHLGYTERALQGRAFFVGSALTGADIQMSFVGDMAKAFDKLGPYPNLAAWLSRMHARPDFQRSIEKGGAYRFA